jgi:hypothetical protein
MTPHPDAGIEAEYKFRFNSCPKHNLLGTAIEALTVAMPFTPGLFSKERSSACASGGGLHVSLPRNAVRKGPRKGVRHADQDRTQYQRARTEARVLRNTCFRCSL